MNVIELIKSDHRKVESLFSEMEKAKDSKKMQKLFDQLYTELTLHAKVEELTLYPSMRNYDETHDMVEEAEEEHTEAKELLEEIKSMSPSDPEFKAKIEELKEAVQHHVEEEESEILPSVSDSMDEQEMKELAKEFQEAKSKLEKEISAAS
ncbi:hemerythrin domain-containing protein [Phormidium sp. LEGE 05292]|uniref:hemerythrin domain-containing protein n=1 Tax=[Phormidium] sp. LEGE 05292 TaxID=767427 RepID=UPI001882F98C|nr:hemerythrin domain-containing protein [Phormidium sp. LEGE 05292]MBE9227062.1 hemerythrin domain-containing protein [Phormidium sp. LEGE 05292]